MATVGEILLPPVTRRKDQGALILLMAVALLTGTFLRVSLLFIYPVLALLVTAYFRFRITRKLLVLLLIVALGTILSFWGGWFIRYKLMSLYYMLPFLLLLFADPPVEKNAPDRLQLFMYCLTAVALVNDVVGLIQVLIRPTSDDNFTGIYSEFSVSLNGLMLLNTLLFFYYFVSFAYRDKGLYLALSLFFLTCSVLGYYGAGLIISIAAFILAFFRFRLIALIKTFLIAVVSLVTIYFLLLTLKPITLEYNVANIKKIASFDIEKGPRKLLAFYNYAISYPADVKDFMFGSGPGTFNSRSAFMIGSPSYFTGMSFIKDDKQPYYFANYAYPLWNESNTIQSLFLDGFRNQPFSSVLAFLGEYGFIFTLAFALAFFYYYQKVAHLYRQHKNDKQAEVYFRFFKFLVILLPLLLLIDNFLEYPEIILLVALCIKFCHLGLMNIRQNAVLNEH